MLVIGHKENEEDSKYTKNRTQRQSKTKSSLMSADNRSKNGGNKHHEQNERDV